MQRLPVRIVLDPQELKAHPLRVGLSMTAEVDVRDTSGPAGGYDRCAALRSPSRPVPVMIRCSKHASARIVAQNSGDSAHSALAQVAVP